MVRAGTNSFLFDEFKNKGFVAIGYELDDLSNVKSKEDLRILIEERYPEKNSRQVASVLGIVNRFRFELKKGDEVLSYDTISRRYILGKIISNYIYDVKFSDSEDTQHILKVKWFDKEIDRDDLKIATKNSLGSVMTLFSLNDDVKEDIHNVLNENIPVSNPDEDDDLEEEEAKILKDDVINQSIEFIKDEVMQLDAYGMQDLVASLLRAMGYKTTVSPPGPDLGKDIVASPDGLGLEDPRIVVEVKHRKGSAMGAPEIRNFMGVLKPRDKGLYVSTGGFTKDAKLEAERNSNPLTLLDVDALVKFIIQYYDNFDNNGRDLIRLTKIYWPM